MTRFQIDFFFLLIIPTVVVGRWQSNDSNNCPRLFKTLNDCTCVRQNTINCSHSLTFNELPRSWRTTNHNVTSLIQTIIRFDLTHVLKLTTLKTDDFHGLNNLEYLFIINTGLVHIRPHAFRHLNHLRELRIESNRALIELNSFALSNLVNVQRISLVANSIRSIGTEAFRNTHSIDILDLSNNPLETIASYAFTGLKSIGTLILCSSQTSCPIKHINPWAFFGFHTCNALILTGLHTSLQTNSFAHISSIRRLDLSHGNISRIYPEVFRDSESINEIDLSSAFIFHIDSQAFDQLNNVTRLNLKGNYIRQFDRTIFQSLSTSILNVDLDNNPIQCDCSLEWYLKQQQQPIQRFKLPAVCTGPLGYECLSPNDLQPNQLPCNRNRTDDDDDEMNFLCDKRDRRTNSSIVLSSFCYHCTFWFIFITHVCLGRRTMHDDM